MTGAPLSCSCGRTFKPGDPHYDMAKSRRAQGLPDHPTDPAQLAQIAQVLVDAVRRRAEKTRPKRTGTRADDDAGPEVASPPLNEESDVRESS